MTMKARRKIPAFRSDREAADYWAKHDSTVYAKDLPTVTVKVSPALRRRIAARVKKPVTLRLEEGQISAAKRAAARMSVPYQTLLRMWIAERLAKELAG
jgi:predicted DNA binding CopG/RHH family protein